MSNKERMLLVLVCIATPFAYSFITQLWRDTFPFHAPAFHVVAFTYAIAFAIEAIGACLAAIALALPLAWLIQRRPLLVAVCLGTAACVTLLPDLILFGVQLGEYRPTVIQVPSLLAFFLVCWLVATIVMAYRSRSAA
jgi:hypothetical protein